MAEAEKGRDVLPALSDFPTAHGRAGGDLTM
jgi:hypothetical protein